MARMYATDKCTVISKKTEIKIFQTRFSVLFVYCYDQKVIFIQTFCQDLIRLYSTQKNLPYICTT